MSTTAQRMNKYWIRHIALPQDHGSWVFLISPLLVGLLAGRQFHLASLFLILGAFSGFLIRQPVSMMVKAYSGRRSRQDLPAAFFWTVVYGLFGAGAVAGLAWQGYAFIMWLAVPAIPVFILHLYLISRRAERRQMGVELVASGVLALAAPGAYWVARGAADPMGWWLFGLTWFQSAASIVYAYLRLEQRELKTIPPLAQRFQMGMRAMMYTSFNLVMVASLSFTGVLPKFLFLAYALQWLETLWGTIKPAAGYRPTAIGIRQLLVSCLWTLIFILTWTF